MEDNKFKSFDFGVIFNVAIVNKYTILEKSLQMTSRCQEYTKENKSASSLSNKEAACQSTEEKSSSFRFLYSLETWNDLPFCFFMQ